MVVVAVWRCSALAARWFSATVIWWSSGNDDGNDGSNDGGNDNGSSGGIESRMTG